LAVDISGFYFNENWVANASSKSRTPQDTVRAFTFRYFQMYTRPFERIEYEVFNFPHIARHTKCSDLTRDRFDLLAGRRNTGRLRWKPSRSIRTHVVAFG